MLRPRGWAPEDPVDLELAGFYAVHMTRKMPELGVRIQEFCMERSQKVCLSAERLMLSD